MLLRRAVLDAIWAGEVTLVFRRWKRPTVKAGGRLRTAVGELAIAGVEVVTERRISAADARAAGFGSRADLLEALGEAAADREVYRVTVAPGGEDPRVALRQRSRLTRAERAELTTRLERLDAASRRGPWTARALALIADQPATLAAELALAQGWERAWFKRNVRKLKELGLTESLEVGYRLSPRGRAFLRGA